MAFFGPASSLCGDLPAETYQRNSNRHFYWSLRPAFDAELAGGVGEISPGDAAAIAWGAPRERGLISW